AGVEGGRRAVEAGRAGGVEIVAAQERGEDFVDGALRYVAVGVGGEGAGVGEVGHAMDAHRAPDVVVILDVVGGAGVPAAVGLEVGDDGVVVGGGQAALLFGAVACFAGPTVGPFALVLMVGVDFAPAHREDFLVAPAVE